MIEMLSPTLLVGVVKSTWLQRRPVSRMKTESVQAGNSGNERDLSVPHRQLEDQHKRSGGPGGSQGNPYMRRLWLTMHIAAVSAGIVAVAQG